jgi:regulatory protein
MPWPRIRKPLIGQTRTDPADARAAGVALLARRDYATAELRARLSTRGFAAQALEAAIAELTGEGLLDDVRYAHSYVSYRAGRGQGPRRIAAELLANGIPRELVESVLAQGPDWRELARTVRRAKFGAAAPEDWQARARQARFLQYRGFSADHIRAATGVDPDTD